MKITGILKFLFITGSILCSIIILYNLFYSPYNDELTIKTNEIILNTSKPEDEKTYTGQESVSSADSGNNSYGLKDTSTGNPGIAGNSRKKSSAAGKPSTGQSSRTSVSGNPSSAAELKPRSININKATVEQLCRIKGIGEATAGKILTYRDDLGGFDNLEQIMNIVGIGQKTYETIRKYAYVK
ncbi:MAG: helix-hairpin-helix domain-containing protein [Oscillospiraceae bacterium]|nr:helix-hairpin-helix domain-containing protein [Oscillospiraceae bacterium]